MRLARSTAVLDTALLCVEHQHIAAAMHSIATKAACGFAAAVDAGMMMHVQVQAWRAVQTLEHGHKPPRTELVTTSHYTAISAQQERLCSHQHHISTKRR
eukprot:13206-Heterococcus_DN1.PRE.18